MNDERLTRKRRTPAREESFNRDGHWTREFYARCEPWPVIEHWAGENGYHLVAMKGKRRLYQKGDNPSFYLTFLDVRERGEGHGLTISAWVYSGFLGRLFHGFAHGSELPIDPTGWTGIWKRREACRDLNTLLERFRQLPIVGSESWHLANIDPTTLAMVVLLFLPVAAFLLYDGTQLEIGPALSNGLLMTVANRLIPLGIAGLTLVLAHHVLAVRHWGTRLAKWLSLGIGFALFTLLAVIQMTRTSSEMAAQKLSYHCIYRFDVSACRKALEETPASERTQINAHLSQLQAALAVMEGHGGKAQ